MKRIKLYGQHDTMQCGAACLKMICSYYGKNYPFYLLSYYCCATTEGVSLLGITEAATQLGFHTSCGRLSLE